MVGIVDLRVALQSRSNVAEPLTSAKVRDLTPADLAALQAPRGVTAPAVKRLRDSHHALARVLATGVDESEAALICGYSPSRVSILKADPTFAELIAHYRAIKSAEFADAGARMASLSVEVIEELRERLEDSPESFTNGTLDNLLKTLTDRTGFGPKATQVNINVGLADRLDAAIKRQVAPPEGRPGLRTIDIKAVEVK